MEQEFKPISYDVKPEFYRELESEVAGIMDRYWITNLSNFSALIMAQLPRLNWAGFYLRIGNELVLGPFQGLPACLRIAWGKGVCGTAAKENKSQRVDDVHAFPGHIACDARSRSELVIPLVIAGEVRGVLDLDSPDLARFTEEDQVALERMVRRLVELTIWPEKFG
jgi:GAF domain-containing protein